MRSALVHPGQVWLDTDRRRPGRKILLVGTSTGYVDAVVVAHPIKPHAVMRATRIALACLPAYYELQDVPCGACGAQDADHWALCPWGQDR